MVKKSIRLGFVYNKLMHAKLIINAFLNDTTTKIKWILFIFVAIANEKV